MIFNEVFNVHFNAVTRILQAVLGGGKLNQTLVDDVSKSLQITNDARRVLKAGFGFVMDYDCMEPFKLFAPDGMPKIRHCPEMPLTTLERRWLKTVMLDPRIQLFDLCADGLEDVEPFYDPGDIVVYDREGDGDPWTDPGYIQRFRMMLKAIESGQKLDISWLSRESLVCRAVCRPEKFEYTELDDRMRLWAETDDKQIKMTLCRVTSCAVSGEPLSLSLPPEITRPIPSTKTREAEREKRGNIKNSRNALPERLVLEITDECNTLERALFHFSHFQKQELVKGNDDHYRLVFSLDSDDFEEMTNRVIAFGPYIRVIEPDWLIVRLRQRLKKQVHLLCDYSAPI